MKGTGRITAGRSGRQRKLLVAAQIALSLVLVIGVLGSSVGLLLAGGLSDQLGGLGRSTALTGIGAVDPGEDLQQRALTGAVRADDAEELAPHHREAHVVQRPVARVGRAPQGVNECLLESGPRLLRNQERPGHARRLDGRPAVHASFANLGESRR